MMRTIVKWSKFPLQLLSNGYWHRAKVSAIKWHNVDKIRIDAVRVKTRSGFEVVIYCEKIGMRICYSTWHFDRNVYYYKLSAHCSHDTPDTVVARFSKTMVLPRVLGRFATDRAQRRAVVDVYLQILRQFNLVST